MTRSGPVLADQRRVLLHGLDIFDYIQRGEDVIEAFQRLSARRQLAVFRYDGFWQAMDTFKDKMAPDSMHARG